jgi:hypothetical protein
MTPKEKAIELVHKFCSTTEGLYKSKKNIKNAKQCALIAVDEIFKTGLLEGSTLGINKKYWQEVKQELETI